jgi:FkbM family methyltransferase
LSQTWELEQVGWTGLLVEPLAAKAAALRSTRKAIVEEVACGPPSLHGSEVLLYESGIRSTLTVDGADPDVAYTDVRRIVLKSLDSLLEKAGIEHIDFLSIDVEGYEAEVLKGTTLERFRPRLVLIEDKGLRWNVHRHMVGASYKRVRRTGINSWYVPTTAEFPVSLFGRFQLFRKFVLSVPIRRIRYLIRRAKFSRRQRAGRKSWMRSQP